MSRRWVGVGWLRALLEAWLLGLLLLASLLSLYPDLPARLVLQGMLFVGAASALWLAARWRLSRDRWLKALAQTVGVCLIFGGGTAWAFQSVSDWLARSTPADDVSVLNALLLPSPFVTFIGFRLSAVIWVAWSRFQRRRLLWSIVQDHLLVAVVVQLLVIVPFVLYNVSSSSFARTLGVNDENPSASLVVRLVVGILPQLILFSILVVIVLIAVLPLSAIASYLVARRTTRRLRALAAATTALRQGDYEARVPVVGEDEVAALQADFNGMAANLSANVRALQAEREKVAALLRSRRDLVAGVSHELRTPMTVMRSYLEAALDRPETDAAMAHDLTVIEGEVTRLQALVDDLFALSRAEVNQLELTLGAVDVGAVVCDVVRTAAPVAWKQQRVELVADVPPDLPAASADTMRLEQVLRNLINNGVRHASPGGLVAVAARAEADTVCLEVRDTGGGIPPEQLPHIWERYVHGANGGSGLGLALVKSLVEAMGGAVDVTSREGEGCTFTVRLPKDRTED